jgi:6-phosphogluconolactonase
VLAIDDSPKPPPARITLSLTALQDVRCAILVGAGAAKAGMLRRAWRREPGLPLSRYQPRGDYHWVLDRDAAKEIE